MRHWIQVVFLAACSSLTHCWCVLGHLWTLLVAIRLHLLVRIKATAHEAAELSWKLWIKPHIHQTQSLRSSVPLLFLNNQSLIEFHRNLSAAGSSVAGVGIFTSSSRPLQCLDSQHWPANQKHGASVAAPRLFHVCSRHPPRPRWPCDMKPSWLAAARIVLKCSRWRCAERLYSERWSRLVDLSGSGSSVFDFWTFDWTKEAIMGCFYCRLAPKTSV